MNYYETTEAEFRTAFFVIGPEGHAEAGFDTKEEADAFLKKKSDEIHGWPNYPQKPVPGYSIKLVAVRVNPDLRY